MRIRHGTEVARLGIVGHLHGLVAARGALRHGVIRVVRHQVEGEAIRLIPFVELLLVLHEVIGRKRHRVNVVGVHESRRGGLVGRKRAGVVRFASVRETRGHAIFDLGDGIGHPARKPMDMQRLLVLQLKRRLAFARRLVEGHGEVVADEGVGRIPDAGCVGAALVEVSGVDLHLEDEVLVLGDAGIRAVARGHLGILVDGQRGRKLHIELAVVT